MDVDSIKHKECSNKINGKRKENPLNLPPTFSIVDAEGPVRWDGRTNSGNETRRLKAIRRQNQEIFAQKGKSLNDFTNDIKSPSTKFFEELLARLRQEIAI